MAGHLQAIHGLAGSGKERVAWHLQVVHGLAGEMVAWHLQVMHGGMTSAKASGMETGESGAGRKRRRKRTKKHKVTLEDLEQKLALTMLLDGAFSGRSALQHFLPATSKHFLAQFLGLPGFHLPQILSLFNHLFHM